MEEEAQQHIADWINTFEITTECNNIEDLFNGVTLYEIMNQIAPEYFSEMELNDEKNNFKQFFAFLETYLSEELNKKFNFNDLIDIDLLCDEKDVSILIIILEFIVGISCLCSKKQTYISIIMAMKSEAQQTLMSLAQSFMARPQSDQIDGEMDQINENKNNHEEEEEEEVEDDENDEENDEDMTMEEERDKYARKVILLEDEKEEFIQKIKLLENNHSNLMKSSSENYDNLKQNLEKSFQEMQKELQFQNTNLREELDHAQERENELNKLINQLNESRNDNNKTENKLYRLEEDYEILKNKLLDYNKIKLTNERMKDKLESMLGDQSSLNERLNEVSESNSKRLKRILELEAMETDMDGYKKSIHEFKLKMKDLELSKLSLTSQIELKENSIKGLNVDLRDYQDKCHYFEEQLEAVNAELQQKRADDEEEAEKRKLNESNVSFVPLEMDEKITRLEHENERMKKQLQEASNDQASETEAAIVEKMHGEIEEREKRCLALELEMQELKRDMSKLQAEKTEQENARNERAETRIKELESQMSNYQSKVASNEALTQTTIKLNEKLKKVENENEKLLKELETSTTKNEKLEVYTKQALKGVQDKYILALSTSKDQIKDRDLRISRLTEQYKQYRQQSQRESQLMSAAVYELGMNITEQRLVRNLDHKSGTSGSNGNKKTGSVSPPPPPPPSK